ncbi:MAG: carboxypeptidase M32 [Proteobacteria bacterium]|nr:carboxypeptidase M32 [Pseudomonadota bacterium]
MPAYQNLFRQFKKIADLAHVQSICAWDEAAMMPSGGGEARAQATATLAVLIHESTSDPRIKDWLEQAKSEDLDQMQKANVREIERQHREATCLTKELVHRSRLASSRCEQAWRQYRTDNNWTDMQPLLQDVVAVTREEAAMRAASTGLSLYDAMLDVYEPGMTSEQLDGLFAELKAFLPGFIDEVLEHQEQRPVASVGDNFPVDKQKELGISIMGTLGFDFDHGRLDVSHHPFCGGVPDDVRITTRYCDDNFVQSLMGVIHETGHAMYEQGLPKQWRGQPVGTALSAGTHESQSLLMEMQACRSVEFIQFLTPIAQRIFLGHESNDPAWSVDNLHRLYTKVQRSYIRVDSDEVTYPLHVILRYEIEKELLEGSAQVRDLPGMWDAKMQQYLSLSTTGNFTDGCLQDVHWPAALFGYFPTYSIGAMTAAQLFSAAKTQVPEIPEEIRKGNFAPLLSWLRTNIHQKGKFLSFDELLTNATGEPLNTEYFKRHLRERYLGSLG